VCRHTPDDLAVLFPTAAVPSLEPPDEWIAIPPVGSSLAWAFLPVVDRTSVAEDHAAAVTACLELQPSIIPAAGAASQARLYRAREWNGEGGDLGVQAGDPGLEPGRTLYVFETVRYDVSTTSAGPGEWLRRSSGPAMQMHPLVGPLVSPHGLLLRYFDEGGEELPTPLAGDERERVRTIKIGVRTRRRFAIDGSQLVDSAGLVVHLRNVH
jgi:hypothetical protein